jgi:dolichol-phosphate mannosyltransferase
MITVVIPCYKVSANIITLLQKIGSDVEAIFVVDDCCPENSGTLVEKNCNDHRVRVIYHTINQGVGGAVLSGYRAAIAAGANVIVKLDGDGQMDPTLIPVFVAPILRGDADYTKGNRFFEIETVRQMPMIRLIGNVGLSFLTKLSSGYWNLFDPTNGYTAISANVAKRLPLDKISRRYFFESDMLFRLNTMRAVVMDIPMFAKYENEQSNLKISRELPRFMLNNFRNLGKRIVYNYFIRNFNYATLELLFGMPLLTFGVIFGGISWIDQSSQGTLASAGTVMLAALPIIMGLQLILGFVNYDMASVPSIPLQGRLHLDARPYAEPDKHPGK